MKKLFNLFSVAVVSAAILTGCGTTDDPTPTTPKTFADSASTYTAKLLGAQNNAAGAFFASSDGTVLSTTEAKANPSKPDISFAQAGTPTPAPKLISPDYRASEGLVSSALTGGTITYFKVSSLNFTKVSAAQLAAITPSASKSIIVEEGKSYEFVNAAGKKGLVYISDYSAGTGLDGSITIDVKVLK